MSRIVDTVEITRCERCGRSVVIAPIEGGTGPAVLDPKPAIYSLDGAVGSKAKAVRRLGLYVSHFSTCPHANFAFDAPKASAKISSKGRQIWIRPYSDPATSHVWKNEVSNRPIAGWTEFEDTGRIYRQPAGGGQA